MSDAPAAIAVVTAALAAFALLATVHVWYAFGVAQVLVAHGVPSWRAWVPLLGEAELFRLGRVDPVRVALFLVPVVSLYALVLKVVVAHRIGAGYGRGAGTTVLAVLLPPVWATVLSGASLVSRGDEENQDDDAEVVLIAAAATRAPAPALAAPPVPGQIAPPAGPGTISPSVFAPTTQPPASAAVPVSVVPGIVRPEPAAPVAPAAAPAATAASVPVAPASAAPAPTPSPEVPGLRRRGRGTADAEPAPTSAPAVAAAPAPAAASPQTQAAPLDEATHIARSPRSWELVLPTGEVVPVAARTIVLGRKPDGGEAGVQYVKVDDKGRTVSKQHARLSWSGESWTITDLGSTNGVALLAADGAEQRLAAGASAPARAGFLLGDARLLVRLAAR